jgi:hypothetical protein
MDQFPNALDVHEGVVAVGRAAGPDRAVFIPAFAHVWPVEDASQFTGLLHQIDRAVCEPKGADAPQLR